MKILLVLLISLFAYAKDVSIVGKWELKAKVKSRPFVLGGLVAYGTTVIFTKNGYLKLVKKTPSITNTKRRYNLKGTQLRVYLENESVGFVENLFMKNSSSSKIYDTKQISETCFEAVETKNLNNSFIMCKIKD